MLDNADHLGDDLVRQSHGNSVSNMEVHLFKHGDVVQTSAGDDGAINLDRLQFCDRGDLDAVRLPGYASNGGDLRHVLELVGHRPVRIGRAFTKLVASRLGDNLVNDAIVGEVARNVLDILLRNGTRIAAHVL